MSFLDDLYNDMYINYLKDGKYEDYKDLITSQYSIGNLYMSKILSFSDDLMGTYGQSGFAHRYELDVEDIVSITSGFLPQCELSLKKVDNILGFSDQEKNMFISQNLDQIESLGHDNYTVDNIDLNVNLNLRRIVRIAFKPTDFIINFIGELCENYYDHISENYYDIREYNWNTENIFWKKLKYYTGFRLADSGVYLKDINNLCVGVKNNSLNRIEILNILKLNTDISLLKLIKVEDTCELINVKGLLIKADELEPFINILESKYVSKVNHVYVDDVKYFELEVTLYKSNVKSNI